MFYDTNIPGCRIRDAVEADTGLILRFIRELASYEQLLDRVVATEELLHHWLFEERKAEVVFCERNGEAAGYALFFHNFSTFEGRAGIYLEDLFVLPTARGYGFGKALLRHVARLAVARGCARVEWSCLNWNEPSIRFYKSLGARPLDEWTGFRLDGGALSSLGRAEQPMKG